jgi:hypothetical protein
MDRKFPHNKKYSRSHINPNLASKDSKESTESNIYSPPIKSSNSPNSAISRHPKSRQIQVPSPLWLYRQPPERSSHILSDCSLALYPPEFTPSSLANGRHLSSQISTILALKVESASSEDFHHRLVANHHILSD